MLNILRICSIDEDEYANSEEMDAMLPEGDTTQEIVSDASGSDHAESEEAISTGDADDGEAMDAMSNAEPDPVGPGSVDAGGIDQVIPVAPPPRQSVNDKIKAEAISAAHQLSHLPKNPFWYACLFGK